MLHKSVLLQEVLEFLSPKSGDIIVDATVGLGGHALEILKRILPGGILVAMDQDQESLNFAKTRLAAFKENIRWVHGNFRELARYLDALGMGPADGILMDLGVSSYQLGQADRGFSFLENGPLDMRMNSRQTRTAAEVLNRLSERELADIFFEFGQERHARRLARDIVRSRSREPLTGTRQFARLVEKTLGPVYRHQRLHPATRAFQALRIYVNDELGALKEALPQAIDALGSGGRLVVISFHSLEDGLVKRTFRMFSRFWGGSEGGDVLGGRLKVLTKKPVRPSLLEVQENPRARSARLRVGEKI